MAGAIQDHGRGLIVGETSFGKGLVQHVFQLPFNSGLTLTTARYYTPYGRSLQRDYSSGSIYDYYTRHEPAENQNQPTNNRNLESPLALASPTPHPHTGRRALYVNDFADRIAGVNRDESDALLASLRAHLEASAPRYFHPWCSGDIVMWDNVGVQHRRDAVTGGKRRHMRQYGGLAE